MDFYKLKEEFTFSIYLSYKDTKNSNAQKLGLDKLNCSYPIFGCKLDMSDVYKKYPNN